jgi:hypothetical protein
MLVLSVEAEVRAMVSLGRIAVWMTRTTRREMAAARAEVLEVRWLPGRRLVSGGFRSCPCRLV